MELRWRLRSDCSGAGTEAAGDARRELGLRLELELGLWLELS